jgi:hypothetical protein
MVAGGHVGGPKRRSGANRAVSGRPIAFGPDVFWDRIDPESRRRGGVAREGRCRLGRGGAGRVNNPYVKSVLAEGMAQLGDVGGALHLIDRAGRGAGLERALVLCRNSPHLRLAARVQGRPGRGGAQLHRLARLGTATAGEIRGAAHRDELSSVAA